MVCIHQESSRRRATPAARKGCAQHAWCSSVYPIARTFRTVATLAVAGVALTAATPAASAQQVAFGVQFGGPRYVQSAPVVPRGYGYGYAPGYGYAQGYGEAPGYYAPRYDWREHDAREAWERREAFGHARNEFREHEYREHSFGGHESDERRGYGYRPY